MAPIEKFEENYFIVRLKHNPRRALVWNEIAKFIQPYLPKEGKVLELGAGYCDWINSTKAAVRFALDKSPIVLEHAARGVEAAVGDAAALSRFSNNSFDAILASNLFEHLSDEEFKSSLSEVRRILRPGGVLAVIQPNFYYSYRNYFDDYTHKKIFTHTGFAAFLEAFGFEIVYLLSRFVPFSFRSVGSFPIFRFLVRAYLYSPWKPFAGQFLIIAKKHI